MGKSTINGPFSIAMLVHQRVYLLASNGVFFLPACIPASEMDPLRAQCAIGLVLDPLLQKPGRWVLGFATLTVDP